MLFKRFNPSLSFYRSDTLPWCIGCVFAIVAVLMLQPAAAIMVGTTPNLPPDTSMNPAAYGPGWTQGDPGWSNAGFTASGLNGVYIGDGWILSAAHVGTSSIQF